MTPKGEVCGGEMIEQAVDFILDSYSFTYSELLYQLPEKQKELMQLLQETQKQYKDNDPDEKVNELFKGDRRLMKNR